MHSPATDSAGDGSCQPGQVILSDAEVSEAVHLFGLAPMHVPASGDPEHTDVNFQASALSRLPDPEVATPAWQSGIVTTASTSSERSVAYQSAAGAATRQPAATSARHREDLKAMKNREAQKRFKQKQKARSNEIEAQLAETTQRLKQLQEQKEQLEARNALLEKVSHFSMTQTSRPFTDVTDQAGTATLASEPEASSRLGPTLTLSIFDTPVVMTFKQLQDMSLPQMSAIWSDYVRAMGSCLLQLDTDSDSSVVDELHHLTSEAMTLIACRSKTVQPSVSPIMNEVLMHKTQLTGVTHLDAAFYRSMLVLWSLSEAQVSDLMHLRRLSITRRVVLSLQRKTLMAQLTMSDRQVLNPTESILNVEELTNELRQNAIEDKKIFYKVARAVHRGVLTLRQTAENLVHAYPHIGSMEVMLEVLAEQRGEPSKQQLVEYAQTDSMAADWQRLIRYHDFLGTQMTPD